MKKGKITVRWPRGEHRFIMNVYLKMISFVYLSGAKASGAECALHIYPIHVIPVSIIQNYTHNTDCIIQRINLDLDDFVDTADISRPGYLFLFKCKKTHVNH